MRCDLDKLKYLFNKENRLSSIISIILFIVGVMFCILPIKMKEIFESFLCFILLAYSGIMLFASCFSSIVFQDKKILVSVIISILVGLLLLFVRSILVLFLAAVLVGIAITKILIIKHLENKSFTLWLWLGFSIFYLIVAVLVLIFFIINKFYTVSMVLIGVSFIIESIIMFYGLIVQSTNEKVISNNE